MQKEHKENSFDGRENTSTSGEFGKFGDVFSDVIHGKNLTLADNVS